MRRKAKSVIVHGVISIFEKATAKDAKFRLPTIP